MRRTNQRVRADAVGAPGLATARLDSGPGLDPYGVAREPLTLELEREWDELADRTGATPFRRPGWTRAWWDAFGTGRVEIAAVRRDGRLVAALPVVRQFGACASPSNWHTPDFGPVASDHASLRRLADALFVDTPRRVSLAFLERGEDVSAFHEAAAARGLRVHERTLERSPYVRVDRPWAEYERELSRNVRGDVGRRRRRLEEAGDVVVDVRDGSDHLDELLTEGFAVEKAGWKGGSRSAIASRPETDRFYRAVARWAAGRGWLRLAFLRLDGVPIAFHYCLEHEGAHYFVKGGHDAAYSHFSPGKVLTHAMLARAFALRLASYEFLGTDDPWKLRWTSSVRERTLLHAFRRTPDGLVEWALFKFGRDAAKRAANLPPVANLRRRAASR